MEALNFELRIAGFEFTSLHAAFEVFNLLDLAVNGFDVSESTTDPTFGDVWHVDRFSGFFNDGFELLLGANEKNFLAVFSDFLGKSESFFEASYGLFKINNVSILALAMDVWGHFWVPT